MVFILFPFQRQRFANLAKFKSNVFKILIATDVASRYRANISQHTSPLLVISLAFSNLFSFLVFLCVSSVLIWRGLDIPTVQVVINHNTPGLPKIYIHRVGRTARAGEFRALLTQLNVNSQFKFCHLVN